MRKWKSKNYKESEANVSVTGTRNLLKHNTKRFHCYFGSSPRKDGYNIKLIIRNECC